MDDEQRKIEIAKWLNDEIKKRGWSIRKTASNAKMEQHISLWNAMQGKYLIGPEMLVALAKGFGLPEDVGLRVAGYLPQVSEEEGLVKEILHMVDQLERDENKERAASFIRWLREEEEKEKQGKKNPGTLVLKSQ